MYLCELGNQRQTLAPSVRECAIICQVSPARDESGNSKGHSEEAYCCGCVMSSYWIVLVFFLVSFWLQRNITALSVHLCIFVCRLPSCWESAGWFGWSPRVGRRTRNDLLLWSPDEYRHTAKQKQKQKQSKPTGKKKGTSEAFKIIDVFLKSNNPSQTKHLKINLLWFLHQVWFSWLHIQSRCRCWTEIHKQRRWECRLGPGQSAPAWAS